MEKHELGSAPWFAAVGAVVAEIVGTADLDGLSFAFAEEYLDPPAHLLQMGEATLAWNVVVAGGSCSVGRGVPDPVTFRVVGSYAALQRMGRMLQSDEGYEALAGELFGTGEVRVAGDPTATPKALARPMAGLHDAVAAVTA